VGDFFVPEKGFKISEEAISRISFSKRAEMGGSTVDCRKRGHLPSSYSDFDWRLFLSFRTSTCRSQNSTGNSSAKPAFATRVRACYFRVLLVLLHALVVRVEV
jgi:hypothetical protein